MTPLNGSSGYRKHAGDTTNSTGAELLGFSNVRAAGFKYLHQVGPVSQHAPRRLNRISPPCLTRDKLCHARRDQTDFVAKAK